LRRKIGKLLHAEIRAIGTPFDGNFRRIEFRKTGSDIVELLLPARREDIFGFYIVQVQAGIAKVIGAKNHHLDRTGGRALSENRGRGQEENINVKYLHVADDVDEGELFSGFIFFSEQCFILMAPKCRLTGPNAELFRQALGKSAFTTTATAVVSPTKEHCSL